MATKGLLALELQGLGSDQKNLRGRWKRLWRQSLETRPMPDPQSLSDASDLPAPLYAANNRTVTITAFGGFKIEARGFSGGWRISSTDEETGIRREFYVHERVIYHMSLWNQSTEFVVGGRVNRIRDSERQAILQAVE
jgi:hypothetical protein